MAHKVKRYLGLIAPLALAFLVGCGGGSTNTATGRVSFKVIWPEKTRLIPEATQSIRARLQGPNNYDQQIILQRTEGQTEATREWRGLQPGQYTLHAEAYPNADASGVILASGSAGVTVEAGINKQVIVVMNSAIVRLEVTPNPATVYVGEQVQLTATAYDAQDNVVLLTPGKLQWGLAGQSDEVTVNGTGLVTGKKVGEQGVSAQDLESGVQGLALVKVLDRSSGRLYMTMDYEPSWLFWLDYPFEADPDAGQATVQHGAVAVATDKQGRIYILSGWGSYSIVRMDDPQGTGRVTYGGTYGSGTGSFYDPWDIWIDSNDRILIADTGNNRIVRIDDMSGAGWTELTGFAAPRSVCTDSQGRIYVADAGTHEVIRVDDMAGTNRVSNYRPSCRAVRVGPSGKVYVVRETGMDTSVDVLTGLPPSSAASRSVPLAWRIAIDSQERMLFTLSDGRLLRLDDIDDPTPEYLQISTTGGLAGIALYEPPAL